MKLNFRHWDFFKVMLPTILLVVFAFYVAYQFVGPPPPSKITMIVGSTQGKYWEFAQEYKRLLAEDDIELTLIESNGSSENYERLQDRDQKIDLGFIQSGIGETTEENQLLGLASVAYEPIWVFHRQDTTISRLTELQGKRIAIGGEGSGTQAAARALLLDNGVNEDNTDLLLVGAAEAVEDILAGETDAAFLVSSPTSQLVEKILQNDSLTFMEFDRYHAYTRRHTYLSHVLISEGLIDLQNNRPKEDKHLLATTATIVTREELHPALIDLLMQVFQEVHEEGGLLQEKDEFPSPRYMSFELSSEADRYFKNGPPFFQRFMPFWVANLLDRLKVMIIPFLTILIPLFKIFPPTYRWKIRSKIYKWYAQIDEIEKEAIDTDGAEALQDLSKQLRDIDRRISRIKVPLSYAYEAYSLRVHLNLIHDKLLKRIEQVKTNSLEQSDDDVDPIV